MIKLGFLVCCGLVSAFAQTRPIVLHAARLLNIETGRMMAPGEVLVQGERIAEIGSTVNHLAGAETIDLGDRTLLTGLIDVHVHLFVHPGAEDLQTVEESVPQRTIQALLAATRSTKARFPGLACGSAVMRSPSSADTRTPSSAGDPLQDISVLQKGAFVMKGGVVYRR